MYERGPYADDGEPPDNPSLTRQALCAKAEELAVELVRWKVWRVEGHAQENLQEAQAIQALAMVLIELLDDLQGSRTAVRTELARALALLGYSPPAEPPGAVVESQDDTAFLRAYGLRFSNEDETPETSP